MVRSNETNVDSMMSVDNDDNQPLAISFDVEDNAVISYKACRAEDAPDIAWCMPVCLPHVSIPRPQRFFGVWMRFPEIAQRATGDDSHW